MDPAPNVSRSGGDCTIPTETSRKSQNQGFIDGGWDHHWLSFNKGFPGGLETSGTPDFSVSIFPKDGSSHFLWSTGLAVQGTARRTREKHPRAQAALRCRHSSPLAFGSRRGRRDRESKAILNPAPESRESHAGTRHQPGLSLPLTHHLPALPGRELQAGNTSCLHIFLLESGDGTSSPDVPPETEMCRGRRVLLLSRSLGLWSDPNSSPYFGIWVEAGSKIKCTGSRAVFSPIPTISLCLAKVVGEVTPTDGVGTTPSQILGLEKRDRDEWEPRPLPRDAGIGMDLPALPHLLFHLFLCLHPNLSRKNQPREPRATNTAGNSGKSTNGNISTFFSSWFFCVCVSFAFSWKIPPGFLGSSHFLPELFHGASDRALSPFLKNSRYLKKGDFWNLDVSIWTCLTFLTGEGIKKTLCTFKV